MTQDEYAALLARAMKAKAMLWQTPGYIGTAKTAEKVIDDLIVIVTALRTVPEHERTELDDWRQAAKVEAGLRREFLARAETAEAALSALQHTVLAIASDMEAVADTVSPRDGTKHPAPYMREQAQKLRALLR